MVNRSMREHVKSRDHVVAIILVSNTSHTIISSNIGLGWIARRAQVALAGLCHGNLPTSHLSPRSP